MVKSPGAIASRSSQPTGNDTGTPGRTRGLYAATTVAPPTRVESTNTLPLAVVLHERGGGDRRVEPLGPRRDRPRRRGRVLERRVGRRRARRRGRPWRRSSSPRRRARRRERLPHEVRDRDHARRSASPSGGSRSSTRCVMRSGRSDRDQRRVVLDRALVREPQQRAPVVAQRVRRPRASTSPPTS